MIKLGSQSKRPSSLRSYMASPLIRPFDFSKRSQTTPKNERLSLLDWTTRHRRYLEAGRAFDMDSHGYLREIYASNAQRMVVQKAGQVGVSEYLISYALHACDQRNATVMYIFPNDGLVSDFSTTRLGPAIEASEYLTGRVVDGIGGDKRGSDRKTLKRIGDRFLYLRGATVKPDGKAPQLKSVPADVLIFDELDEIDPRAPAIARKRLGHSSTAEERMVSTPMYPGRGVHAEYMQSDMRRWLVPCPHCGHKQALTIHQCVTEWDELERPAEWHGKSDGRAWLACDRCKGELNRLAAGEWVAEQPGIDLVGYHIPKFVSPFVSVEEIVANLSTTDETKRREAFNQDLGEPYTPRGGSLTDVILDSCRGDYAHGVDASAPCFMGVDVGRVLHVVVRAKADSEGKRRQLFAGEVPSFDELGRLIRLYNPRAVVIDALPETKSARQLQSEFRRGLIWLAYYTAAKEGSKKEKPIQWDFTQSTANLDRTRTIDETFARFIERSNTLPANARDIRDYYRHLIAPVRVLEDAPNGAQIARYVESGPDHYAHSENYCLAASECPLAQGWTR